jgi:hypothetical protein
MEAAEPAHLVSSLASDKFEDVRVVNAHAGEVSTCSGDGLAATQRKREYNSAYYQRNKEKQNERSRLRYEQNKDEEKRKQRARSRARTPAQKQAYIEYLKSYYAENREYALLHQRAYNKTIPGRISNIKGGAKRRGMEMMLLDKEIAALIAAPCRYCQFGDELIGIDRVNNNVGYCVDNSVPCCDTCNRMKSDTPVEKWFAQMERVLRYYVADRPILGGPLRQGVGTRLKVVREGAARADRAIDMSTDELTKLVTSPCHYCGFSDKLVGIDRVNNDIHYTLANCVPACKTCNFMKRTMTVEQWMQKMRQIIECFEV